MTRAHTVSASDHCCDARQLRYRADAINVSAEALKRLQKVRSDIIRKSVELGSNRTAIVEKTREAAVSVLPIVAIVIVLCLFVMPMQADLLLCFLIGGLLIVAGMGLFSLGAEQAMMPIGSKIGTALTKTKICR